MILEVCWDGLWTLSFGVSQFHGHGSRLVCEVALRYNELSPHFKSRAVLIHDEHPFTMQSIVPLFDLM